MPTIDSRGSSILTPTYTEYTYDALGNRTNVKDPKNNNTAYTYDNLNRMTTMTQTVGRSIVTQYGYDTHDNLTSVTDPKVKHHPVSIR